MPRSSTEAGCTSLFICLSSSMSALAFCLLLLAIYPFACAQNYDLQPLLRDYGPQEGPLTPDYGYFSGRSPYYGQKYASGYNVPGYSSPGYNAPGYNAPSYNVPGYGTPGYNSPAYNVPGYGAPGYGAPGYNAPGYNAPGNVPFSPYGGYPDPYSTNAYGTSNGPSYPQRDFPYGETPNLNNGLPNNPYPDFANRGPNSDPSGFYNAPNNGLNIPRPQYDNYAPTYTTPLGPPIQDNVSPFYQPLPAPIPSESPNVIKEEPDGKHMSVAGSSTANRTFLSPEYDYKQIVVPDVLPTNPNAITEDDFGGYALANISEPYNPEFKSLLNPQFPRPFPSQLPPIENSAQAFPSPQVPFDYNSEIPPSFLKNPQAQFAGYPNQGQVSGSSLSSFYPTSPSPVIPDITLSGSSRKFGNPPYPFRPDPPFSENAPRGYPSRGFLPSPPVLPNPKYEAPGRSVAP